MRNLSQQLSSGNRKTKLKAVKSLIRILDDNSNYEAMKYFSEHSEWITIVTEIEDNSDLELEAAR